MKAGEPIPFGALVRMGPGEEAFVGSLGDHCGVAARPRWARLENEYPTGDEVFLKQHGDCIALIDGESVGVHLHRGKVDIRDL